MKWTVFEGKMDGSVDLCDTKYAFQTDAPGDSSQIDNPPWPNGSWDMKLFGQQCTYASDGNSAGTIRCDSMNGAVDCLGKQDPNNDLRCVGLWGDHYKEVARCMW